MDKRASQRDTLLLTTRVRPHRATRKPIQIESIRRPVEGLARCATVKPRGQFDILAPLKSG